MEKFLNIGVNLQMVKSAEGNSLIKDVREVAQKKFMADTQSVKRLTKYFVKSPPSNCQRCICNTKGLVSHCKIGLRRQGSEITLCELVELLRGRDLYNEDKNLDKE